MYRILTGDKAYSSWSLRGWLLLAAFDLPFEDVPVRMYDPAFDATILRVDRLDKNLHNMYDSMNAYLTALEKMQEATSNLAESFSGMLVAENEEFVRRRMAESYEEDDEIASASNGNANGKPSTSSSSTGRRFRSTGLPRTPFFSHWASDPFPRSSSGRCEGCC